jgi:hypothetical protein
MMRLRKVTPNAKFPSVRQGLGMVACVRSIAAALAMVSVSYAAVAQVVPPGAQVARTLFRIERRRTLFGLSLMVTQAFSYNAILHYTLVLTDFYDIPGDLVGWYLLPFAAENFLGPVVLGRL